MRCEGRSLTIKRQVSSLRVITSSHPLEASNMKVVAVVALIVLAVACDARSLRRRARYQPAGQFSSSAQSISSSSLSIGAKNIEVPQPYSFEYAVKDAPTNNDFGHQEVSDGRVVTGSYRVLLPDGRTQIVTYRADENGYVAKVRYEGEAIFPPSASRAGQASPAYSAQYL